jgi:two-component system, sensor histidine kinase LadS
MKKSKITIFLFWPIFVVFSTNGANISNKSLVLNKGLNQVGTYSRYLIEDSSNNLTIDKILSSEWQNKLISLDKQITYNEHKSSTYWMKLLLQNPSTVKTWLVEFPDPHMGGLELYIVSGDTIKVFQETGFDKPFSTRSIEHKNFLYEITIPANGEVTLYAKIKSVRFCGIDPNIRSVSNFSDYFLKEYHLLGLYYGIIFILIAYNFFLGLYSRENLYFFYCFYTICCAFYTFAEDGLGFQWIWGEFPWVNTLVERGSFILLLASFLLYSNSFLELKATFNKVRFYILSISVLYVFCLLFYPENKNINNFLITLPFTLTCYAAIKIYKDGFRPARFFVLGNSIILLSIFVYFFRMRGWLDSNTFTVYLFNFGFIFEAVILSISLSDKFKITKDQKDSAQKEIIHQLQINDSLQQKVNKELEGKVKERTKELQSKTDELQIANNKLEELKKELYAMNSKMDVNIWELKKEVKKEVEARVLNDTISLEEFSSVYTDVYCYQYLKDLKWKDGFECPKCSNKKFGRGNNNFTYKCTQCQHQESVTSNTLFHAIKFPISKAFYLAYYLHKNGNDVSYEELALKLELSKNTAWKFGKKVIQIVDAMGKKAKASDAWDRLILTSEK